MAKNSLFCPLLKKGCVEHKCAWYTTVQGTNPQTGHEIDKGGCAITFIPLLQIEQTKAALATQSATVEVRENVMKVAKAAFHSSTQPIQPVQVSLLNSSINDE